MSVLRGLVRRPSLGSHISGRKGAQNSGFTGALKVASYPYRTINPSYGGGWLIEVVSLAGFTVVMNCTCTLKPPLSGSLLPGHLPLPGTLCIRPPKKKRKNSGLDYAAVPPADLLCSIGAL